MTSRSRHRAAAAVAAATLLVSAAPFGVSPGAAAAPAADRSAVRISVTGVAPVVPTPTTAPSPITFGLTVTNSTGTPLDHVHIVLERGNPIEGKSAGAELAKAQAKPAQPGDGLPIKASPTGRALDLPAGAPVDTTFSTVTSIPDDQLHLCLCAEAAIYPLTFIAEQADSAGTEHVLGFTTTYLPTTFAQPRPVQVAWVWPLLERPHRVSATTVFTDDDLAASVSDGRLARALEVLVDLGPGLPVTVVLDPELLDELEVMATGHYQVQVGTKRIPGTGQAAAQAWLAQLATVLTNHPDFQIELTPYADPDVESLTRHDLTWATAMPAATAANVAKALGDRATDDTLAWPAGGAVSTGTLQALVHGGVLGLVLNGSSVTPHQDTGDVPDGRVQLSVDGEKISAALTSATIEKYADSALGSAGALPNLLSQLSVQAVQEPTARHTVVITPPRYVDPDVFAARQAITQSSTSTFTSAASVQSILQSPAPAVPARLGTVAASAGGLPGGITDAVGRIQDTELPALTSMLDPKDDAPARALLDSLPGAVQRLESSAWQGQDQQDAQRTLTTQLSARVESVQGGVHIVKPSSGSYTLASNNSPLPITVKNDLPYRVTVRVEVETANALLGFTARPTVQVIEAREQRSLHLQTRIERSGRIQVNAVLEAPNGAQLGRSVPLTVHSTALGVIGVVITIVAGVVLVLALLVRFYRRWRRRGRKAAAPLDPADDQLEPAP